MFPLHTLIEKEKIGQGMGNLKIKFCKIGKKIPIHKNILLFFGINKIIVEWENVKKNPFREHITG